MAADISGSARAGVNVVIDFGIAAFVVGLLLFIGYKLAENTNTSIFQDLFGPITQNWGLLGLLVMLGAGLMILIPVIKKMQTELRGR